MPATIWYPEDPDDEFDFETEWKEVIDSANEPGGGVSLSVGAQEATVVGMIPRHKERAAARYFLGFTYADDGEPYRLYREPPAVHPRYPNLRCHGFSAAGYVIQSNPDNPATVIPGGTGDPGDEDVIVPGGQPFKISPFEGPLGEVMRYSYYTHSIITLRFKSFGRMRFLTDDEVTDYRDEIRRYTRSFNESAVQTLSVDNKSMLKFDEGAPSGLPFPAPLAQLLARSSIKITWFSVPHNYISSSSNYLNADKLVERLGTVNSNTMLGNLPGTLLFNAFQAEEVLFPVLSNEPLTTALTGWNITFAFEQFDPPKGVVGSPYRGHRVFPYAVDGKWYHTVRENSSDELLPLTDFSKLTQHWLDPS